MLFSKIKLHEVIVSYLGCYWVYVLGHIAQLRQQCHSSKSVIFQVKRLKVLKCY
jgi:hypothetical protein